MRYVDLVAGSLARAGDKVAVVGNGRSLTFAEVDQRIDSLAAALHARGAGPGDRVALLAGNEIEYLEIQAACLRHGLALVPLNTRLAIPELVFILNDSEPKVIILGRSAVEAGRAAAAESGIPSVLELGDLDGADSYDAALAAAGPPPAPPSNDDLVSTILYTSGTTGRPKGAMIDRRGFTARVLINSVELGVRADDSHLVVLPLFHIAAFLAWAHVANGGSLVMLEDFTPTAVFEQIEEHRASTTCLVPTIIQMLTDAPDRAEHDLSSLRLIIYGGSSIEPEPLRRAIGAFGCEFHQQFGMTETGGQTILRPADHDPADTEKLGSAGTEAVAVQVRIVDDGDVDVPAGEKGEIICQAPSLMTGYLNRPEATAEAFRGGWFHTGDVGYRDAGGYLHISDRRNDVIITGGENVYPREVEAVIGEHPAVIECAVVGAPDPTWGETVVAVLVGDDLPTEEELRAWARERLAGYKLPRRWIVVPELPRNVTGKVLKHRLRLTMQSDDA